MYTYKVLYIYYIVYDIYCIYLSLYVLHIFVYILCILGRQLKFFSTKEVLLMIYDVNTYQI